MLCRLMTLERGIYSAEPGVHITRATVTEFVGTFILVFATAVATSAVLARTIAGSPSNSLAVGLAFALVLTGTGGCARACLRRTSQPGGDPGVGEYQAVPVEICPGYVIAQFIGAISPHWHCG